MLRTDLVVEVVKELRENLYHKNLGVLVVPPGVSDV